MGNVLNSGENNDDLVNILRLLRYIKTKKVERVFRAVDRGDYVLASHRDGAYKDASWKIGNIHLSAPCIYSKVMEGLALEEGMSFLNIGSGTGYLSTMAGLILGHHGSNHGIELHKDCMEYAYERLDEFKQKSLALNEFDFCEPVFMHGNFLRVIPNRQYDRIYCGAACPESHKDFICQFVKVGGILVMPYKENLLRIERVDTDRWRHRAMLPVAFANLIIPKDDDQTVLQLPVSEPLSLQDLCRCSIRCHLRRAIFLQHPELETRDPISSTPPRRSRQQDQNKPRHPMYSIYESSGSRTSSDDEDPGTPSSGSGLLIYMDSEPRALPPVRAAPPKSSSLPDVLESSSDEDSKPPLSKKISISSLSSTSSSSPSTTPKTNGQLSPEPMIVEEIPPLSNENSPASQNPQTPLPHSSHNSDRFSYQGSTSSDTNNSDSIKPLTSQSNAVDSNSSHSQKNPSENPTNSNESNLTHPEKNLPENPTNSNESNLTHPQKNPPENPTNSIDSNSTHPHETPPENPTNSIDSNLAQSKTTPENPTNSNDSDSIHSPKSAFEGPPEIGESSKLVDSGRGKRDIDKKGKSGSSERWDCQSPAKKKRWRKLGGRNKASSSGSGEEKRVESPNWDSLMSSSDDDDDDDDAGRNDDEGDDDNNGGNVADCEMEGIDDAIWDSLFGLGLQNRGNPPVESPENSGNTGNGNAQVFAHNLQVENLSEHMRHKIRRLPLPTALQVYVNYSRPL